MLFTCSFIMTQFHVEYVLPAAHRSSNGTHIKYNHWNSMKPSVRFATENKELLSRIPKDYSIRCQKPCMCRDPTSSNIMKSFPFCHPMH